MRFQLFNMPDGRRYCQVENGKTNCDDAPGQHIRLPEPPPGATDVHLFGESKFRRHSTPGARDDGNKPSPDEEKESCLQGFLDGGGDPFDFERWYARWQYRLAMEKPKKPVPVAKADYDDSE
jgi:hypothetical protein